MQRHTTLALNSIEVERAGGKCTGLVRCQHDNCKYESNHSFGKEGGKGGGEKRKGKREERGDIFN